MVADHTTGKIIFVSSFLGYMSLIGYSSYAPAKHAVRGESIIALAQIHLSNITPGLAETLRSELLLYSIGVHIFFPGTIYSPGYVEENKTKPKITLKIEESDDGLQPDQAAAALLRGKAWACYFPSRCFLICYIGVQNGNFHISGDLLGNLFRSSTRGATPHNNIVLDAIYSFIGWVRALNQFRISVIVNLKLLQIGLPIWRRSVDGTIVKHRAEHEEYLGGKGFFRATEPKVAK